MKTKHVTPTWMRILSLVINLVMVWSLVYGCVMIADDEEPNWVMFSLDITIIVIFLANIIRDGIMFAIEDTEFV